MARTTLTVLTAIFLAITSVAAMVARYRLHENELQPGPGTWKVTMKVHGRSSGDVRLMTATPLDIGRQRILREVCQSEELLHRLPQASHPARRQVIWTQRAGAGECDFRARYEFLCKTTSTRVSPRRLEAVRTHYAPPGAEHLECQPGVESDSLEIAGLARGLVGTLQRPGDQAEALFRYVSRQIGNEPMLTGPAVSALECLQAGSADSGGKSRLLLALLRNRGIPSRLVTGLILAQGSEQPAHVWVEAWVRDHWLPMCPCHHYFGRVPRNYLIFGFGDLPMVRARDVTGLGFAFLAERLPGGAAAAEEPPSWPRGVLHFFSFHDLPPAEQRLAEFLLLLPLAALVVCLFRNVIGLISFGTFAPALLGLAFRELTGLPGIAIFVGIVLAGWLMRHSLDRYHLLQVPRMAVLLTLVVVTILCAILVANQQGLAATRYVSLFPMIILTGMIERFWTLEAEDGTLASFRTLAVTMLIAAVISLIASWEALTRWLYLYPETLGLIVAGQLLIGRYTGYRLTELWRFRELLREPARS